MDHPFVALLAGLAVTALLSFGVKPLVRYAVGSIDKDLPSTTAAQQKKQWLELVKGDAGGKVLGWLERLMFFGAFAANMPLGIGAWLAFKVASKWNVWENVILLPTEIEGVEKLGFLIARRRWGSAILMSFLIGTAYNIIAGFIGGTIFLHWAEICRILGFLH